MAEELLVTLNRSDSTGFGFSLLGTAGLPHVIYDIIENSPAADSGKVEAGDVILRVNEVDVNHFSTKEVLKCLRLSSDPVTLKLKRDPEVKAQVLRLLSPSETILEEEPEYDSPKLSTRNSHKSNGSCTDSSAADELDSYLPPQQNQTNQQQRKQQHYNQVNEQNKQKNNTPRFEAYMMTGDLMLNLSRTQQSTGLLPKGQKKVDSLTKYNNHRVVQQHHRHHHHHHHHNRHNNNSNSNNHHQQNTKQGSPEHSTEAFGVRTSRSEDHLQLQKDPSMNAVDIDIDEDVTSSLNTLLDTRSEGCTPTDRIVWTYNAPVKACSCEGSSSSSSSTPSSAGSSPTAEDQSLSPASPTSVSSSVMSSNSGFRHPGQSQQQPQQPHQNNQHPPGFMNGELSQSEAISNMSSPDYNDEETMDILSSRDLMMVSDPSDSDSTILASEPQQHRIVIQVKGPEKRSSPNRRRKSQQGSPNSSERTTELSGYQELRDYEEEQLVNGDWQQQQSQQTGVSPPHSADEESDIESLHSFHYSPKAVDLPSATRLAKRLYLLDGFKKSDVSRHLSKNNDFSRAVADKYLSYFSFEKDTLDVALRKFLAQFSLTGETQERERVLVHFSKRFLDCNPGTFNSQDAVHTLTCAIMLLNTDLHGQNIGRKMSCSEFIENLAELNDGENFPREVLKQLYNAIKSFPLQWALDEEVDDVGSQSVQPGDNPVITSTGNPFLDVPNVSGAMEFKKGYVMRKCCYDSNGKKTPFGKRGWKMYYCTLRELVLYLHKDEHGFRSDSLHNAIRIHHALATKATDYTKKQHVFRLQTADQAEYLFQTSDSKELQSWIDTINFVCASFSSQPLAGAVGSQRKFQRPLLPCSHTKLSLRDQLRDHEERVNKLEVELDEHRRHPPERGSKALTIQNYKEKEAYMHYELKRYKTYVYLLRSKLTYTEIEASLVESSIGEVDESTGAFIHNDTLPPGIPERPAVSNSRIQLQIK